MANGRLGGALRDVQMLFEAGTAGGLTDAQLLEEVRSRSEGADQRAFAALVERHGPAVLRPAVRFCATSTRRRMPSRRSSSCWRKAGSLRVRDSLGPWLHQVACRVAANARASAARRRRHERRAAELADSSARDRPGDDLGPLIHEEIDRLPGRYRAPIVLCFLEGLTREQAAGQLRWPVGTVQSRLARGRQRLRERLIRRGVTPGAVVPGAVPWAEMARAVVPAALADATTRAAMASAAERLTIVGSISAPAALTEEVLKTMWFHKLKMIAGAILSAGTIATGAAWALQPSRPDPPAVSEPRPVQATEDDRAPDETIASPAPDEKAEAPAVLKYGDGQADGKQSLGGSGEMIAFTAQAAPARVTGLRIHGSRYGQPDPPDESFLIYFLTEDRKRVLHTELAPYSLFERGPEQWVEVTFERPVELPKTFWVALDFRPHQTKGVYVSFDTSTGGRHSLVGLPGTPTSRPRRGGDWMIEAVLAE